MIVLPIFKAVHRLVNILTLEMYISEISSRLSVRGLRRVENKPSQESRHNRNQSEKMTR